MNHHGCMKMTLCATALAIAFPVFAQEAPKKSDEIQEVLITASKRKESVQAVPMSVDALTGDALKKQNIQQLADVEKLSPGLVLNTSDGRGQNVALRGITFDPDSAASATVQIYWNETPLNTSDAFRSLFDIGRIEVLRGPQGTLRGQTSPAGAITIATRQPDLTATEGTITQSIGQRGLFTTQAAVSVPLIADKLAIRVAAVRDRSEDGIHNASNGRDNNRRSRGGRVSVLYQPAKEVEISLVHQQLTEDQVNYPINVGAPVPGQAAGPRLVAGDRLSVVEGNYDFYNQAKLTSFTTAWTFGSHKLSYIGGLQKRKENADRDNDVTNIISDYSYGQVVKSAGTQRSHELRVESTDNPFWNYMVGAYYSKSTNATAISQIINYYYLAPYKPPLSATMSGNSSPDNFMKSSAVFTDHRFAVTPNDIFEAGLRVQKNQSYSQQYLNIFGAVSSAVPETDAHLESKRWTGSASFKHNFNKDVMAYAAYGSGYRPGGSALFVTAVGLNPNIILFKPETSNSLELGFKSKLLNRKLTLNADIFQQKLKNYIARTTTIYTRAEAVAGEAPGPGPGGTYPVTPGTSGYVFNSNGDVVSRGIEATAIYSIIPGWQAQLSVSYVDAHYDNARLYCNDSNNDGIPDAGGAFVQPGRQISLCRSKRPLADSFGNEAGRLNATLQSEYAREIGSVEGFVRGLVRYVPPSYNLELKQNIASFTPVDLFLGVRDPGHKWEFSVWAQNVFNRELARPTAAAYIGGVAGGYTRVMMPQQRKVGVTLRYDFDS